MLNNFTKNREGYIHCDKVSERENEILIDRYITVIWTDLNVSSPPLAL